MGGQAGREWLRGVVLPLLLLTLLVLLGMTGGDVLVMAAFAAVVPALAAVTASVVLTSVTAGATVVAVVLMLAGSLGSDLRSALPVIIGVIAVAALAVMAASMRTRPVLREVSATVSCAAPVAGGDALQDPLTGLPTRAAILADPPDGSRDRLLGLLDVDDLARINDEHGRAIGDTLLFAVAGRARYSLDERGDPADQRLSRWGDDAFLLVMSDAGEDAQRDLRAILAKVNENPIRTDAGLVPATIGCGAVTWHSGEPMLDAVGRARMNLHRAKARGAGQLERDPA